MGSMGSEPSLVQLPIIDISQPSQDTARQLVAAAEQYGFLYIRPNSSGFTPELVDNEFSLSQKFFASSLEEKNQVLIDKSNRGWTGLKGEILDPKHQRQGDFKEALNMADFVHGQPQQPMPPSLQPHIAELAHFNTQCKQLCNRILDLFALGLEVEPLGFFSSRHTEACCTVRLLHYPPLSTFSQDYNPEVDIRAGAHSDYGSITLLFQRPGQPGLEIRTPTDNSWAPVPVYPEGYDADETDGLPPILVNIGDLLSYWTNGLLRSTVHRVIFPATAADGTTTITTTSSTAAGGNSRYSIAYFGHPNDDTELVPVPSKRVAARQPNVEDLVGYGGGATDQRAMTAKEHLMNRLRATYGFHGAKGEAAAEVVPVKA